MRLVMGALAGAGVDAVLDGDESLRRRPMERVAAPLREMGADIATHDGCAPVTVRPASLVGRRIALSVASAQLKSALLLAGLSARGETTVVEPEPTRDHSERMLAAMGVGLRSEGEAVSLTGPVVPAACDVTVPGDPSSAAFFAVAAALVPDSDVCVERVCLNPGRTGFVEVLRRMGADVRGAETGSVGGEPVGEIRVRASALRGTVVEGEEVPGCVDEIPVLAVAAAFAEGDTEIRGAAELRVKESDRIQVMADGLVQLGIEAIPTADGIRIRGGLINGGRVDSHGDHRIAMSFAIAGLRGRGEILIDDCENVNTSFPGFVDLASGIGLGIEKLESKD